MGHVNNRPWQQQDVIIEKNLILRLIVLLHVDAPEPPSLTHQFQHKFAVK